MTEMKHRIRPSTPERRKVIRLSQAKRRKRARENGMCSICCVRVPKPGYKTCPCCIARVRARQSLLKSNSIQD